MQRGRTYAVALSRREKCQLSTTSARAASVDACATRASASCSSPSRAARARRRPPRAISLRASAHTTAASSPATVATSDPAPASSATARSARAGRRRGTRARCAGADQARRRQLRRRALRRHVERSVDDATTARARRCARTAPTAQLADFPVDWVIGGKRMQDDVTVFPDGRWQVLPVYFHVTGGTRGSTTPRPSRARSRPSIRSTGRTCAAWRTTSASTATPPALDVALRPRRADAGRRRSPTPASPAKTATARARATPRRQETADIVRPECARAEIARRRLRALPRSAQAAVPAARCRASRSAPASATTTATIRSSSLHRRPALRRLLRRRAAEHVELRVPGDAAVGAATARAARPA